MLVIIPCLQVWGSPCCFVLISTVPYSPASTVPSRQCCASRAMDAVELNWWHSQHSSWCTRLLGRMRGKCVDAQRSVPLQPDQRLSYLHPSEELRKWQEPSLWHTMFRNLSADELSLARLRLNTLCVIVSVVGKTVFFTSWVSLEAENLMNITSGFCVGSFRSWAEIHPYDEWARFLYQQIQFQY